MKFVVFGLIGLLLSNQLFSLEPKAGFLEKRIEKAEDFLAKLSCSSVQTLHRHAYLTAFMASVIQVKPLRWHHNADPITYLLLCTLIQGALLKTFTAALMDNYQIPRIT